MTRRCRECDRPLTAPTPDGYGPVCRRRRGGPDLPHPTSPAPHPVAGQLPLEEHVTTETTPTTDHVLIEDRTARHDLYVAAADYIGDGEEADALLDGHADDVRRARDEQFAAWLVKKARESRSSRESTPDYLVRLADKVMRGAIR